MRLKKILVEGLFDRFTHVIPLNLKDRITIIHGPNGFGKTMILRMINAFFNQSPIALANIPFRKLLLDFDNGSVVSVHRKRRGKTREQRDAKADIEMSYTEQGKAPSISPRKPIYTRSSSGSRSVLLRTLLQNSIKLGHRRGVIVVREKCSLSQRYWIDIGMNYRCMSHTATRQLRSGCRLFAKLSWSDSLTRNVCTQQYPHGGGVLVHIPRILHASRPYGDTPKSLVKRSNKHSLSMEPYRSP